MYGYIRHRYRHSGMKLPCTLPNPRHSLPRRAQAGAAMPRRSTHQRRTCCGCRTSPTSLPLNAPVVRHSSDAERDVVFKGKRAFAIPPCPTRPALCHTAPVLSLRWFADCLGRSPSGPSEMNVLDVRNVRFQNVRFAARPLAAHPRFTFGMCRTCRFTALVKFVNHPFPRPRFSAKGARFQGDSFGNMPREGACVRLNR